MLNQWIKAFGASFLLIVGTLAMFEPAGAETIGAVNDQTEQQIA